jgi:ABC-type multidrug transport system fused ATPase/permease subunit
MSALDSSLEETVRRAIKLRFADRTVLLITHRLGSVVNADHLIHIEAGRIRAEGTPSELLNDSTSSFSKALSGEPI